MSGGGPGIHWVKGLVDPRVDVDFWYCPYRDSKLGLSSTQSTPYSDILTRLHRPPQDVPYCIWHFTTEIGIYSFVPSSAIRIFPRSSSSPYTKNSLYGAEIWIPSMSPLHFISVPAITTTLFCTILYISCIFIESRYTPRKAICTASKHLTPSSEFFHENLAVANPFYQPLYFKQFEATQPESQQHGVCLAEPEKPQYT